MMIPNPGHMFAEEGDVGALARMIRNSRNGPPLPDEVGERLLLVLICAVAGIGAYETVEVVTPGVFHAFAHLFGQILDYLLNLAGSVSIYLNHGLYYLMEFVMNFLGIPILGWIAWKRPVPVLLIDLVGIVYLIAHW